MMPSGKGDRCFYHACFADKCKCIASWMVIGYQWETAAQKEMHFSSYRKMGDVQNQTWAAICSYIDLVEKAQMIGVAGCMEKGELEKEIIMHQMLRLEYTRQLGFFHFLNGAKCIWMTVTDFWGIGNVNPKSHVVCVMTGIQESSDNNEVGGSVNACFTQWIFVPWFSCRQGSRFTHVPTIWTTVAATVLIICACASWHV